MRLVTDGILYDDPMLIIPAIDLKDNKCVRLRQGRLDKETVYSDDPVKMADHWVEQGARRLHVIDLNGAAKGHPCHLETVRAITQRHPDLTIQVGGGIRDDEHVVQYLDMGVQYVILGTRAISQPHLVKDLCLEFTGHVIIGLDVKDGKVASAGWSKLSHHDIYDLAKHYEVDGVASIVYTDIESDGMLSGLNVDGAKKLAAAVNVPVIVAGGVRDLKDVEKLCLLKEDGVIGAITGRALYEKTLDFAAAQELTDKLCPA